MDGQLRSGAAGSVQLTPNIKANSFKVGSSNWLALGGTGNKGAQSARSAYQKIAWMRAAVKYRSGQVAGIPFIITAGGDTPIFDSSIGTTPEGFAWLGKTPHFLRLTSAAITLEGKAPVRIIKTGNRIEDVFWFNPLKVKPKVDINTKEVTGYLHDVETGEPDFVPLDEMAFVSPLDVYDERWQSVPDSIAALVHAEIFGNLNAFLSGHLSSGLLKSTIFKVPQGTALEERSMLSDWMSKNMAGARSRKKFAIMEAESVEPITIGEGLTDLHNTNIDEEQRRSIAAALQVPISVLDSSASHFSVSKQDALQFMQLTGKPDSMAIAAEWNMQMFNPVGMNMEFQYNRVEQFQDQKLAQAEAVTKVYQGGLVTLNEGRAILELEEVPQGNTFFANAGVSVTVGKSMSLDEYKELENWKKKALKQGRDIEFKPMYLSNRIVESVKSRLKANEPVHSCFEPPWS